MLEIFVTAFVTCFIIIDPLAVAPIFGALTDQAAPAYRRKMAVKGTLIATLVLAFFAAFGQVFLDAIGVSLAALKVAGGVMLFIMALEMVFEKRTERREKTAEQIHDAHPEVEDISVFPIAVPMLGGPGAIATCMLLFGNHSGDLAAQGAVAAALALVLVISLVLFLAIGPIMRTLGTTFTQVLTRVLGLVLAAFAAEFILGGVRDFFGLAG